MDKCRVSKLRKEKGWTQEKLSEKSYVTVRTIQRLEAGEDVSLETLASISNALSVRVSDLFESIDTEGKEREIMDVSKEQFTQIRYRKKEAFSLNIIAVAIILMIMSFLAINILKISDVYNTVILWFFWVSLLLFLIAISNYYLGVKLSEKLDEKYPLSKGIPLDKKDDKPIENVWQFLASYWWLIFPVGGFLIWFIPSIMLYF